MLMINFVFIVGKKVLSIVLIYFISETWTQPVTALETFYLLQVLFLRQMAYIAYSNQCSIAPNRITSLWLI